jgi:hypothetical protein
MLVSSVVVAAVRVAQTQVRASAVQVAQGSIISSQRVSPLGQQAARVAVAAPVLPL